MTSTTHFKPMTNNTNVAKSSFVKQAATGVAFALAPFAIALGVSAAVAPSAEASWWSIDYHGTSTRCTTSYYGNQAYTTCR